MKKTLLILLVIICTLFIYKNNKLEENIIPDEAIRFRVIANSNSVYDQNIKIQIRNEVQNKLLELTKNVKTIDDERNILNNNVDLVKDLVKNKIKELNYDKDYKVHYGLNYFPEKEYKGIKYKDGNYESLVITLGDGKGDNWWCVLFPPLCLIETNEESTNNVDYKFFIKELINKYIK